VWSPPRNHLTLLPTSVIPETVKIGFDKNVVPDLFLTDRPVESN